MDIVRHMLERAGLTESIVLLGKRDPDFERIIEGMALIHQGKEVLYGHYVETHGNDPKMFALMEHFADLKRKYIRAEQFMKKSMDGKDIPMVELFDTYSDMAVYAAMGLQLIWHLEEREKNESTSSTSGGSEPERGGTGVSDPTDDIPF